MQYRIFSALTDLSSLICVTMTRLRLVVFVAGISLFGFVGSSLVHASDVETFNAAFAKANEARKAARASGHEWRDTAKLLKSAQKSAEDGDFEKAMSLVATAQLQGEQALIQAQRESSLWKGRVIR